ncbi:MAG: hypothetical protein HRU26_05655 [Psychroserpens sp.]|nr:hypothetical protein [Psychroserpens sp.]
MANNIIKTTELIQKANEILAKHAGYLDMAADSYQNYAQSSKLPSDYVNSLKRVDDIQKKIVKSTKDVEKEQKKLQRERVADLKLQKKREQAFDKYEKQLEREQRLLNRTQGLYNKVQRGINEVTRKYQDLAVRKELNGKLSAEEEITLGRLEAKLLKYQTALKKVDANIGKHTRNVGNYKSGFDGLGFSIAQLTREAPAFANSMETGFMAISNNLPIFFDEIAKVNREVKELRASGTQTSSVLSRLGSSFFSLQTLLSVGVTLLTIYGSKLVEFITNTDKATTESENFNKALKEQNNQIKENIQLQNQQLRTLRLSLKTEELRKRIYDAMLNPLDNVADKEALLLELRAKLDAAGVKNTQTLTDENLIISDRLVIANNLIKLYSTEIAIQRQRQKVDEINLNLRKLEQQQFKEGSVEYIRNEERKRFTTDDLRRSTKELIELQKQKIQLEDENNSVSEKTVVITASANKEAKESISIEKERFRFLAGTIPYYEQLISSLQAQQKALGVNKATWDFWQVSIDRAQKSLQELRSELGLTTNEVGTAAFSFPDIQAGFDRASRTNFENDWKDTYNTVSQLGQQAYNTIAEASQASLQTQLSDLETQKNVALQFAGESATAREEIERQYDERRRAIQQKQAQNEKTNALFSSVINTANAVVQALPNIPLSITVGTLGAAQTALIAAQQVPQFWQGGIVGGQQQIMVNDDPFGRKGANYKEVIEKPNGQLLTPTGKNVKMTVPKGTIVHPTYDAFIQSLDSELLTNNIMPVGQGSIMPMVINQGLTKEQIKEVFGQEIGKLNTTIKNKESVLISHDRSGFNTWVFDKHGKRKIMNNRYKGKGGSV